LQTKTTFRRQFGKNQSHLKRVKKEKKTENIKRMRIEESHYGNWTPRKKRIETNLSIPNKRGPVQWTTKGGQVLKGRKTEIRRGWLERRIKTSRKGKLWRSRLKKKRREKHGEDSGGKSASPARNIGRDMTDLSRRREDSRGWQSLGTTPYVRKKKIFLTTRDRFNRILCQKRNWGNPAFSEERHTEICDRDSKARRVGNRRI